jgi:hypothetical protein
VLIGQQGMSALSWYFGPSMPSAVVSYLTVVDQLIGGKIVESETQFQNGVQLSPPAAQSERFPHRIVSKREPRRFQQIRHPRSRYAFASH